MKRAFQLTLGVVYLLVLVFSLIVLTKSGASEFYKKQPIDVQNLTREGNAFAYQFGVDTQYYNPETILILEGQQVLTPASSQVVLAGGSGTFGIKSIDQNQITILMVPNTPTDPKTNGHSYSIYIRPYLISSNLGGLVFLLLLLGLIVFLASSLVDTQKRKLLFGSSFGVLKLYLNLFDRPIHDSKAALKKTQSKPGLWLIKRSAITAVLASFLYVFMEWVFYITKPSFMDVLTLAEKVKILLITGLALSLFSLFILASIFLLDILLTPVFPSFRKYAFHFPAVFLGTCLCLLLLDNFTYTIFKFGILDSTMLVRILYGLGFVGVFIYFLKILAAAKEQTEKQFLDKIASAAAIILFAGALILAGFSIKLDNRGIAQVGQNSSAENKPNIILFGTDGVNAANMSVYGYQRDTTPYIAELAKSSLLSQNNFSNAGSSLGSDTATLTGKSPVTTRVLYSPDILRGANEYQHLPGILKSNGYRTVFLGEPYYDDVNAANFQNAFDVVNCANNPAVTTSILFSGYAFDNEIYFLTNLEVRIADRFEHIFFIRDMKNPFIQVNQTETQSMDDQKRMGCLLSALSRAKQTGQPVFVQVHLEATHGMSDGYDDGILDFDTEVKGLVQYLKDNGQYNNTILILYTDHAQKYITTNKIPLLFHFPNDQYAAVITQNTQNIDIAPTILNYLKIDQPGWMEGSSLLGNLEPNRLILDPSYIQIIQSTEGRMYIPPDTIKPPFYQFGSLSVIQCQNWFTFDLQKMTVSQGMVTNYVNPCPADSLDSLEVIRGKVGKILTRDGFNLPGNW